MTEDRKNIQGDHYKLAVTLRGGSLCVSASAGCGKTTAMTARVTELLLKEEAQADRILVMTFTNAAAAEMKQRIKDNLAQYADSPVAVRQWDALDAADISTIDKFCKKLCKQYFNIAGVSPDFSLIDEGERDAILLPAVAKVLKKYDEQAGEIGRAHV